MRPQRMEAVPLEKGCHPALVTENVTAHFSKQGTLLVGEMGDLTLRLDTETGALQVDNVSGVLLHDLFFTPFVPPQTTMLTAHWYWVNRTGLQSSMIIQNVLVWKSGRGTG